MCFLAVKLFFALSSSLNFSKKFSKCLIYELSESFFSLIFKLSKIYILFVLSRAMFFVTRNLFEIEAFLGVENHDFFS